jgi:hypothetical protein
VVEKSKEETIASLVAVKWTEHKGIFERYPDLIAAQEKMLTVIRGVDKGARLFRED